MTIAILTFLAVFLLLASGGVLAWYRPMMRKRLASAIDPNASNTPLGRFRKVSASASVGSIISPFRKVLPTSSAEVSVVQKRLIRAGYRKKSYVNVFYGAKVAVPAAAVALTAITQVYAYGPLFAFAIALGLGFLLPDFWLGYRISTRQLNIRLGLPEALDLLVICVEAGLSLDQALLRVADELKMSQPEISDELGLVNLEQRAGRPRAESWKNLAERTAVDTVRALVNTLVQADTFGTSVAKTLRVYSDTLRVARRQQAEEQAAKTTVKLVFPLVFFIFPSLFVVAVGPSAIVLLEGIDKYLLSQ